jgi:hypothetical protein
MRALVIRGDGPRRCLSSAHREWLIVGRSHLATRKIRDSGREREIDRCESLRTVLLIFPEY